MPGSIRVWMMAARPATLPAAVVPILVGTAGAVADGFFEPAVFLAALLASLLIQVGTNFANDYFDFKKGADTAARLGPVRVTQSGLLRPSVVRNATVITFALAAMIGLYLVVVGGWPILAIGLASIAAGVLYTGGPWPFGYHGLGDLFVFVFFGLVAVLGTYYLHTGTLAADAVAASIPVASLVTAIIVVNNLRDRATDRASGKRTLAVMIGPRGTRVEYIGLLAVAYLLPLIRWASGGATAWALLPWLTIPLAVAQLRIVLNQDGRALNAALKGTARLHLMFGVLLAASALLG